MAVVDLRYARALAAVVSEQKLNVAATQGQLNDFADTLEASAELREVLENPSIPEAQKLKVLDAHCHQGRHELDRSQLHRRDCAA